MLLLCGGALSGSCGCGHSLLLSLRMNHKEDKFLNLGNDLTALLRRYQEMAIGGATSHILYKLFPKEIMVVRGLDSYTTW